MLGLPREDFPQFQVWASAIISVNSAWERGIAASVALKEYLAAVARGASRRTRATTSSAIWPWPSSTASASTTRRSSRSCASCCPRASRPPSARRATSSTRCSPTPISSTRCDADRSLMPQAIEEALRWEPPLLITSRVATRDTEVRGAPIPAGANVTVMLGAANRDPNRYADPDRFDIFRDPKQHISFGHGPHMCLGMHLARMETRVAVDALLDRLPEPAPRPRRATTRTSTARSSGRRRRSPSASAEPRRRRVAARFRGCPASSPSPASATTPSGSTSTTSSRRPTTSSDPTSGLGSRPAARGTSCASTCPSPRAVATATTTRAITSTSGSTTACSSPTRSPSFYVYRMGFHDEQGRPRQTAGVIGALELSAPGQGDVLPHERTMSKPKDDRLNLMRACRANLSPVWGLSLAERAERALRAARPARRARPPTTRACTTASGASANPASSRRSRRPWRRRPSSSPTATTATRPRSPTATSSAAAARTGAHDLLMAYIVELADEQLTVRPIHRLVSGLPAGSRPRRRAVAVLRRVRRRAGVGRGDAAARMADAGALGAGRPRPGVVAAARDRTRSRTTSSDLDSSRLAAALDALPDHDVAYQHGVDAVVAAVREG